MAFLRFSRDRRGVENFYLVQPTTNRRGKVRPRVHYWFRSPPDVKVGRQPFDASVRRALELQNPGVEFDWRAIVETPIPSADADRWRERRRAERAAKNAAAEGDGEVVEVGVDEPDSTSSQDDQASAAPHTPVQGSSAAVAPQSAVRSGDPNRKRRRRRRPGGGGDRASAPASTAPGSDPIGD